MKRVKVAQMTRRHMQTFIREQKLKILEERGPDPTDDIPSLAGSSTQASF